MIERLVEQIEERFEDLSKQMTDPGVIADRARYAEVGRAYRALEPAHKLAEEYRKAADDAAGARELLSEDGDDPELRDLLRTSEERLAELEDEIRLAMVEPDPNDEKDVIVEVRAGTGGEEAGLFAGDVYRMLTRYAERRGFKPEPLSVTDGDYTFAIRGRGAYSVFKFEGGTHRVQRVPETESQGRIHTSTASGSRAATSPACSRASSTSSPPRSRPTRSGAGSSRGRSSRAERGGWPRRSARRATRSRRPRPSWSPRAATCLGWTPSSWWPARWAWSAPGCT